ncbi:hypothetical protein ACIB24_01210 [Spongisporangium articulatum]|uniref:Serine protease n=1 Tax=Spongisporangium articulatum TaxID=3362603 RepID=A0ABW8AH54_9ACTN
MSDRPVPANAETRPIPLLTGRARSGPDAPDEPELVLTDDERPEEAAPEALLTDDVEVAADGDGEDDGPVDGPVTEPQGGEPGEIESADETDPETPDDTEAAVEAEATVEVRAEAPDEPEADAPEPADTAGPADTAEPAGPDDEGARTSPPTGPIARPAVAAPETTPVPVVRPETPARIEPPARPETPGGPEPLAGPPARPADPPAAFTTVTGHPPAAAPSGRFAPPTASAPLVPPTAPPDPPTMPNPQPRPPFVPSLQPPVVQPLRPPAPEAEDARPGWRNPGLLGSTAAGLAVVLAAVAAALTLGGGTGGNPVQAAVTVTASGAGDPRSGGGVVVDAGKGLILTSAWVAAPRAIGMGVTAGVFEKDLPPAPKSVTVTLPGGGQVAAQVVAADGYLNVAVLKAEGVGGSSATLGAAPSAGEGVTVVGADDEGHRSTSQVTLGRALNDPRLGSGTGVLAVEGAATTTDGPASAGGQLVGMLSTASGAAVVRPIAWAQPLIDAAVAGTDYLSPYAAATPKGAEVTGARYVEPGIESGSAVTPGCSNGRQQDGRLSLGLEYDSFGKRGLDVATGAGLHTDVLAELWTTGASPKLVARADTAGEYPVSLPGSGCLTLTFTPLSGAALDPGAYALRVGVGGNLTLVYDTGVRITE